MRMAVGGVGFEVRPAVRYRRLAGRPRWSSDLHLDLLIPDQPSAAPSGPAVVYFHGGGWSSGGREQAMYPWINPLLASAGLVTAAVTYRLSGTDAFPAQLDDAVAAIDWLQQHSDEFGVDPSRVGVWGDSAGGHLALLVGTAGRQHRGYPGVRAVVARCAPSDFIGWSPPDADSSGSPLRQLFGGPYAQTHALRVAASPLRQLARSASPLPAFQLVHGDCDETVPFHMSETFVAEAVRRGAHAELHRVTGGHHNMGPDEFAPWSDEPWTELGYQALRFFQRHL